jgi:hypothetical protein
VEREQQLICSRSHAFIWGITSDNRCSDKSLQSCANFVHIIPQLIRIQECLRFKMRTGSSGSGTLG